MDWTNAPQTHEAIPVSNSATPPPPTLSVLYAPDGDRSGQRVVVDHTLDVGRVVSDFGGMPFDDGQMSRLHATIRLVGDQVTVEDGGSTNGTMVNGLRVQRQHLQEGDILQIGSTFFGYDRLGLSAPEELEESDLAGASPVLLELSQALRSVAPRRTPVLISGESGAGKRAVARELIRLAQPSATPVVIQCGAGPTEQVESGLFGGALGAAMKTHEIGGALKASMDGTLVLVDVEQLSLHAQAWLYWTLEESSRSGQGMPPRLIATTSLTLDAIEQRVRSGGLRADLFGMLRSWFVEMQPLRHRRQDIPILVGRCVTDFEQRAGNPPGSMVVEPSLMWALIEYPWPRNIDELRTVVEAACVEAAAKGGPLTLSDRLQRLIGGVTTTSERSSAMVAAPRSRSELLAVLQEHGYVISRVADHFGKHRQQVYRWMDRFQIERSGGPEAGEVR